MSAQTFNGWANYETWNVCLDPECCITLPAMLFATLYGNVKILQDEWGRTHTPDNVAWDDANIDGIEVT